MKVNSFVKAGLLWLGFSILLSGFGFAQTATAPANGDGSFSNPYEIASLENLYWLSQNNTEWDKDYIQTADIDASETVNWDNGAGFSPIGTYSDRFAGSYNGDGYRIENLYINRPETRDVGFIGVTGRRFQEIKNIHLINADFTGYVNAGGIVGQNYSQIERCSFEGTIDGYLYIGGITGNNSYEIS